MALLVGSRVDLTEVYKIIDEKVIPTIKNEYLLDKRKSSGNLIKSLDNWEAGFDGDTYTLKLRLPVYWRALEYGRPPTTGSSGIAWREPVRDITNWMINKHIRPVVGRDIEDVAYAIVRKIHKFGFKGANSLERGIGKSEPYFKEIAEIIGDQIGREVFVDIDTL